MILKELRFFVEFDRVSAVKDQQSQET